MKRRADFKGYIRYIVLGILIWLLLALRWGLLSETAAKAEPIMVRGGLPDPMPAIAEAKALDDIELVVKTVACECGPNEPLGCYDAVTQTIITRAKQEGLTYKQVVLDPWQYSCWNSNIPTSLQRLRDNPEEMLPLGYYRIIEDIVRNALSGADSPFVGIDHYWSSYLIAPPLWAYKMVCVQIGCHRFCRRAP